MGLAGLLASAHDRALRSLVSLAERRHPNPEATAAHLDTGGRGELEALFHLRHHGYTVVKRRWKTARLRGDIDLIAWDAAHLCFVEVKTRTVRGALTAESAVDPDKQDMLRRMARAYLRRFPEKLRADVPVRFDIVSVYLLPSGVECELYRGAFGW